MLIEFAHWHPIIAFWGVWLITSAAGFGVVALFAVLSPRRGRGAPPAKGSAPSHRDRDTAR